MEAMQRHVLKLFRREKTPSSPGHGCTLTQSKSENNLDATWRGKVKWRSNSADGNESDSAKYWSSAKTQRKLKHLCTKRALPPLPPGAKSSRIPDIFHHQSPVHRSRGVDSPAHIYEEIQSWAVEGDIPLHQDIIGSSEALISPTGYPSPKHHTPFDNHAFQCGESNNQTQSVFQSVNHNTHHHAQSHTLQQKPQLHPKTYNKPKLNPHSEAAHSSRCSFPSSRQHIDLLDLNTLNARSENCLVNLTQTNVAWRKSGPSRQERRSSLQVKSSAHISHPVSRREGSEPSQLSNLDTTGNEELHGDELDKLELAIPVQDTEYFVGPSLCATDDPLAVYEANTRHKHDDSIDGCYEYDISGSMSSGTSHSRTRSDASTSSGQKDTPVSADKGSFRSHDGSHGKSESSSNDTFSEYDLKSDSSAYDAEGDYEHMLAKIRDNLRLKEDVQKLVSGSQKSDSSHTLTAVSSLSEISTLGEDEVRRLMNSNTSRASSQYSLSSSSPTDHNKQQCLPERPEKLRSARQAHKLHCQHALFKSSSDLSHSKSSCNDNKLHKRTQSVSCLRAEDEGKLSCRVSSLKPESIQRRSSRTLHKPNVRVTATPKKPYKGSNKLLADIMQRNHDRQTLFL